MPAKRRITKKTVEQTRKVSAVLTFDHQAKLEREKRLAMWAGVGFFMAVIFVAWLINFKNNVSSISGGADIKDTKIEDITANFKTIIAETKKNMEELGDVITNSGQVAAVKLPAEMERRIELEKLLFSLNDKLTEATGTGENK
ncbi:MAG: hypothetical protein AAB956_03415 [Patescibacteria group bacterium]